MVDHVTKERELDKILLLLRMPICYNSLVMENTNRCNARCRMCYQSAGEGKECGRVDLEVAERCIREAAEIETVGSRFHLAGGETFLYPDECYTLFQVAYDAGFASITATTNGFWGSDLTSAREKCARMRDSGVTGIELSWDHWHGEFIPARAIDNCLLACRENDIDVNLRLLSTKRHKMDESLSLLDSESLRLAQTISCGPVIASGRAMEALDRDDIYMSERGARGSCFTALNLTVNSFGEVFPCCSGFETCRSCAFGNIYDTPISEIVSKMNSDPMLRQLVFMGAESFLPMLHDGGCEIREGDYRTACEMCSAIFSDEDRLLVVREEFCRRRASALGKALEELEKKYGARWYVGQKDGADQQIPHHHHVPRDGQYTRRFLHAL